MDQRFIGINYDNCDEDSDHDDDYGARDNSTIFNDTFSNQVLRMSNLDPEHRNDPLNDVFPKVKVFLKTTFISNIHLTIIGCPVKVKVNVYLKTQH